MPSISTHAQLEAAVHDLTQVICQWPSYPPVEPGTDSLLNTLQDTIEILTGTVKADRDITSRHHPPVTTGPAPLASIAHDHLDIPTPAVTQDPEDPHTAFFAAF
jgi:hypothetical protein